MNLLYINDELATGDGSNSHAIGMLKAFKEILGEEHVEYFPSAEDGSSKPVNLKINKFKNKFKGPLTFIRYFRKKYLSIKRSKAICLGLQNKGFIPTHVLARSTSFDITAIYVAQKFKAKLIYEVNTPMFYECGIIKKEPMVRQIEKWEKKIICAADYVYVVSNICRDMLSEHYNIPIGKFIVVPNGYIEELYNESKCVRKNIRNQLRKSNNIEDKFVITFIGSLKVWHGIETFCKIAEKLSIDDRICFLVLGDGEMHDMIVSYVSSHNNMIFKGKVSLNIMKQYLYASDLGIMPYERKENFYYSPLKMFDMIGSELPFIGTSVGQIREICEQNNAEILLKEKNKCWEELILSIVNNTSDHYCMEEAVKKMKNGCTWKARAYKLIKEIER